MCVWEGGFGGVLSNETFKGGQVTRNGGGNSYTSANYEMSELKHSTH